MRARAIPFPVFGRLEIARVRWSLFQKATQPTKDAAAEARTDETTTGSPHIRCPQCHWQPSPNQQWVCADCPQPESFVGGCGARWNTFTTHGICPGCGHQWQYTSCPRCRKWSLHNDWYTETKSEGAQR